MKEAIIIGICIFLVVLVGCERPRPCVMPKPIPKVVCDNQDIWDNRGKINNFDCRCDNDDCNTYPVTRRCTAGIWALDDGSLEYIVEDIICIEVYT